MLLATSVIVLFLHKTYLFHGSSQCCGTLRSLLWAVPTSGGELFFNN